MKRSELNSIILDAEDRFDRAGLFLPEWAHWTPDEWHRNRAVCGAAIEADLGWDITDFGSGSFGETGLLMFTARNGKTVAGDRMPYAEKLMVVRERQVTPYHFHWKKIEDIINRGGGDLIVRMQMADRSTEEPTPEPFTVYRDAIRIDGLPGETVRIRPGQSITLYPWLYHTFWAEGGDCIVGEVSSVNDDTTDNRFLEPVSRFPDLEEDVEPQRLICIDYARL